MAIIEKGNRRLTNSPTQMVRQFEVDNISDLGKILRSAILDGSVAILPRTGDIFKYINGTWILWNFGYYGEPRGGGGYNDTGNTPPPQSYTYSLSLIPPEFLEETTNADGGKTWVIDLDSYIDSLLVDGGKLEILINDKVVEIVNNFFNTDEGKTIIINIVEEVIDEVIDDKLEEYEIAHTQGNILWTKVTTPTTLPYRSTTLSLVQKAPLKRLDTQTAPASVKPTDIIMVYAEEDNSLLFTVTNPTMASITANLTGTFTLINSNPLNSSGSDKLIGIDNAGNHKLFDTAQPVQPALGRMFQAIAPSLSNPNPGYAWTKNGSSIQISSIIDLQTQEDYTSRFSEVTTHDIVLVYTSDNRLIYSITNPSVTSPPPPFDSVKIVWGNFVLLNSNPDNVNNTVNPVNEEHYLGMDIYGQHKLFPIASGGSGTGKIYATVSIGSALSNYTTDDVDYLCTGVDDHNVINQAIQDIGITDGKIVLLDGVYNLGGGIVLDRPNITIEGMGINATTLNIAYSYGINDNPTVYTSAINIIASHCSIKNLSIETVDNPTEGIMNAISYWDNTIIENVLIEVSVMGAFKGVSTSQHNNNYSIFRNVTIQGEFEHPTAAWLGFQGSTYTTFENCHVKNCVIATNSNMRGFQQDQEHSKMQNCSVIFIGQYNANTIRGVQSENTNNTTTDNCLVIINQVNNAVSTASTFTAFNYGNHVNAKAIIQTGQPIIVAIGYAGCAQVTACSVYINLHGIVAPNRNSVGFNACTYLVNIRDTSSITHANGEGSYTSVLGASHVDGALISPEYYGTSYVTGMRNVNKVTGSTIQNSAYNATEVIGVQDCEIVHGNQITPYTQGQATSRLIGVRNCRNVSNNTITVTSAFNEFFSNRDIIGIHISEFSENLANIISNNRIKPVSQNGQRVIGISLTNRPMDTIIESNTITPLIAAEANTERMYGIMYAFWTNPANGQTPVVNVKDNLVTFETGTPTVGKIVGIGTGLYDGTQTGNTKFTFRVEQNHVYIDPNLAKPTDIAVDLRFANATSTHYKQGSSFFRNVITGFTISISANGTANNNAQYLHPTTVTDNQSISMFYGFNIGAQTI